MNNNLNFKDAFNLYCKKDDKTLTLDESYNLLSLFLPVSDNVLNKPEYNYEELYNLYNTLRDFNNKDKLLSLLKQMNNGNDMVSKNTLYYMFKNANKLSTQEYNNFLNYLNLNQDYVNVNDLTDKLSQMYY